MSPLEAPLKASDRETLDLMRRMLGREKIALAMAVTLAKRMDTTLDIDVVCEAFGIAKSSAYEKIRNAADLADITRSWH